MVRMNKLFNNHVLLVSTVIIATSFVALFFVNNERFYNTSSSVLAPEFDFNSKLKSLTETQKTTDPSIIRNELLMKLANEHIPIIMCGFYDLITGPKRLQKPDSIDEGRWLQQVWAELMESMGIPANTYMSIMELRYSWFTETKDSFETFQSKLEPSFVKATLERYIKANGNFAPTSIDQYNQALQCKLYRTFSKSASLLNYMKASATPTTQQTSSGAPNTTQQVSSGAATTTQQTTPGAPNTTQQVSSGATPTSQATHVATTSQKVPLLKWVVPSNFAEMCLDKGNRLQCFLMSILIIVFIICIVSILITLISPLFYQQPQSQF